MVVFVEFDNQIEGWTKICSAYSTDPRNTDNEVVNTTMAKKGCVNANQAQVWQTNPGPTRLNEALVHSLEVEFAAYANARRPT